VAVLSLEIRERSPLAGGKSFGDVGPYEQIRGTLEFGVDPRHPDHQVITDIDLAPTDDGGRVRFSSDFLLLKPVRSSPGGTLLVDILNRGNRTALRAFNDANLDRSGPELLLGNEFLMRHAFTIACCGWQHDVPAGMAIRVPEATENGERLHGQTFIQYQLTRPERALLLSDAGHHPLPAADLDDPTTTLTVREHPDGTPTIIDRARWRFARVHDGQVVPDPNYVHLTSGFEPGAVYEIVYTTIGAPVIGLGFLAVRDCVAFLTYGTEAEGNPAAGTIEQAVAYGQSQCGRFLREYIYVGANADEGGRRALDGVYAHTGSSRRGEFNLRFGQPSTNILCSPSTLFPMTYSEQTDPVTGQTDGLLTRIEARGTTPKVIATNTGVEYWWSGASLAHTDAAGTRDAEPPPNVRIYSLAGAHHLPGTLPISDRTAEGDRLQYPLNTMDHRPAMRAALLNLDRWVRGIAEPPPSQHPRIADGTAVRRESLAPRFQMIPGVDLPKALPERWRLDFGPEAERGVLSYPPKEGAPYPILVSAVDDDGNEIAGIRLPDVRVPLATHTGWTLRHADIGGAGHFIPLLGAAHPFPKTAAERKATGDPRPSIQERYASRDDYLARIREAVEELIADGYLLAEDTEHLLEQAAARYDAFAAFRPDGPA
jgi:hypothetical protein